jgi:DNA-binding beta-propeller fold protein YncE
MFRGLSAAALICLAVATTAEAQRPDMPPQSIDGPDLDLLPVAQAAAIELPPGFELDQVAAVAIGPHEELFVLNRGVDALLEFGADGRLVRAFARGLFERAHGLYIDASGAFWIADVGAHTVVKLDTDGAVLLTLGTPGQAGEWAIGERTGSFDQPTDVAIGPDGSIFVTQGHNAGEPRVLKFDSSSGRLLRSWGGRGTAPWQFAVAHSVAVDADGQVYVADRENRRILVFDADGGFRKGWLYRGMACSLHLASDGYIYMVTGFDGQVVKLDRNGLVVGTAGRPGSGLGEFGEAHDIAVMDNGAVFVADVVNRRLQKFVPRLR